MKKAIRSLAGASVIALLALSPATASADPRYHRDWDRGPDVSVGVGPGGVYIGRRHYHRYSYDYGPDWRYRHHYGDHYRNWDDRDED